MAVWIGLGLTPAKAETIDLGLTPSHVYGLWTNINHAIIDLARVLLDDDARIRELEAMKPKVFSGKAPADVLKIVAVFRAKLNLRRHESELGRTTRLRIIGSEVTPSVVFLSSGHVLDSTVELLVQHTGPNHLISQYYVPRSFSGKRPDNVFGLVDLANRRMQLLLAPARQHDQSARARPSE